VLIDNGANVNDADINGCTALYRARQRGHEPNQIYDASTVALNRCKTEALSLNVPQYGDQHQSTGPMQARSTAAHCRRRWGGTEISKRVSGICPVTG